MSTYEVSLDHIGYLVNLGYQLGLRGVMVGGLYQPLGLDNDDDRTRVVKQLVRQNQLSVGYRFNGLPSPPDVEPFRCVYRPLAKIEELAQALQWVSCYRYQSSETPDWPSTFAYAFTSRLTAELVRKFIAHFETAWDYNGERLFPNR